MRCICTIEMMPLRAEASHKSEMTSMLLEGEYFNVLESREVWHKVQCEYDGYEGWVRAGKLIPAEKTTARVFQLKIPISEQIKQEAIRYLNTPYLWGGRSHLGIDCSGFTQVVFKTANIKLPRDAWQQAEKGETIASLEEIKCGDLAFFSESGEAITHVGILLGDNKIIHASDFVRIDGIDENGIYNTYLEKHTLKPVLIKRYFNP